ncbi:type II secretion system F family protein [Vibrio caribbeanicus]|uniref:type II secretion system F family protein n=1 Tax=Vibrio caribbeanicus TaxID=701175 RepID=UPI002283E7AB|nr:type II secretion system F family protein [Vibrio caribbeanicus]MCY9843645.1 type II secretion system F family protein [Vibrio caribbeanicus]
MELGMYPILVLTLTFSFFLSLILIFIFESMKLKVKISKLTLNSFHEEKNKIFYMISRINYDKDDLEKRLFSAGFYHPMILKLYYPLKYIIMFLFSACILISFIVGIISLYDLFLYNVISVLMIFFIPDKIIGLRIKSNIKNISSRLPFLLDLMNVCVHTGMTIESSLEYLAKELQLVDRQLARVVTLTVERAKIVGLDKALQEFYDLVPTSESQSMVMTLVQSLQFGSSVGAVLSTLSKDIRELNMMDIEEKIGKMGAKMTMPLVVFIMIPMLVLIVAPKVMRVMI